MGELGPRSAFVSSWVRSHEMRLLKQSKVLKLDSEGFGTILLPQRLGASAVTVSREKICGTTYTISSYTMSKGVLVRVAAYLPATTAVT